MPACVPIKDMRDTATFAQLVQDAPGPITVTKNGYDQFVVIRSSDYDQLCQQAARSRLLEQLLVAERERANGQCVDGFAALDEIAERYGL